MAQKKEEFTSVASDSLRRRLSTTSIDKKVVPSFTSLTPMWAGIAGGTSLQALRSEIMTLTPHQVSRMQALKCPSRFMSACTTQTSLLVRQWSSHDVQIVVSEASSPVAVIPFAGKARSVDPEQVEGHILDVLRKFSQEHLCKFLGAGVTLSLLKEVSGEPNLHLLSSAS